MKILLVGGWGYIGRYLSNYFAKSAIEVNILSSANGTGIDAGSGLFRETPIIPNGTQVVIYLAQSPYYRDLPKKVQHLLSVNTLSAVTVAEASREKEVRKLIYFSTGTIYASSFEPMSEESPLRRDNWYALSKIHAEESLNLFRKYMDICIIRPFAVYGPNQVGKLIPNLIDSVKFGRPITLQSRAGFQGEDFGLKISVCFIDDLIKILSNLIFNNSPHYINISSFESLSIKEISNAIGKKLNKSPNFIFSDINRDTDLIADISLLKRFYNDFTSFEEGLSITMNK